MADVILVAVILAFFAIAVALVKACDRIIGPDVIPVDEHDSADAGPPPSTAEPEALAS